MRHVMIHNYGKIDPDVLADTVRNDFPPLIGSALCWRRCCRAIDAAQT
jgi:uncharacterized protein with HEPN domain